MNPLATFGRQAFAALLCLSLVVWSVLPTASHAPTVFEAIQGHLEMIADHGHSHVLDEDLYWAMHGHSHDVADHDHTQAFLTGNEPVFDIIRLPGRLASESIAWRTAPCIQDRTTSACLIGRSFAERFIDQTHY